MPLVVRQKVRRPRLRFDDDDFRPFLVDRNEIRTLRIPDAFTHRAVRVFDQRRNAALTTDGIVLLRVVLPQNPLHEEHTLSRLQDNGRWGFLPTNAFHTHNNHQLLKTNDRFSAAITQLTKPLETLCLILKTGFVIPVTCLKRQ